jgi:hypothetical protein
MDMAPMWIDNDFPILMGAEILRPRPVCAMESVREIKARSSWDGRQQPDPASMDTWEFCDWLESASIEELESFGSRAQGDGNTYYDVFTRTLIYRDGTRKLM